jgi:hypothetical protein
MDTLTYQEAHQIYAPTSSHVRQQWRCSRGQAGAGINLCVVAMPQHIIGLTKGCSRSRNNADSPHAHTRAPAAGQVARSPHDRLHAVGDRCQRPRPHLHTAVQQLRAEMRRWSEEAQVSCACYHGLVGLSQEYTVCKRSRYARLNHRNGLFRTLHLHSPAIAPLPDGQPHMQRSVLHPCQQQAACLLGQRHRVHPVAPSACGTSEASDG